MSGLRILPTAVAGAVTALLTASCADNVVHTVPNAGPGNLTPTMVTTDVDTYVSDSGFVKYHAVTDVWEMYENTDTPFWRFPSPLVIDTYHPGMVPAAHVECDSALYYSQRRLFRFDGHVTAINVERDTFLTQQLFWDQDQSQFYTDSFIHIVKSDRIIEGYGFRSNEKMSEYTVNRPTAILPASSLRNDKNAADTTKSADTLTNTLIQNPLSRPAPTPASMRQNDKTPGSELKNRNSDRSYKNINRNSVTQHPNSPKQ